MFIIMTVRAQARKAARKHGYWYFPWLTRPSLSLLSTSHWLPRNQRPMNGVRQYGIQVMGLEVLPRVSYPVMTMRRRIQDFQGAMWRRLSVFPCRISKQSNAVLKGLVFLILHVPIQGPRTDTGSILEIEFNQSVVHKPP